MYLVLVCNSDGADAEVPTSVTGNGITWTEHATSPRADALRRVSAYRGLAGGSPSSGALTVNYATAQTGCLVHIVQLLGADTGGTNGSNAIVQAVTANWTSTSNPSITLSAFADAVNNCAVGTFNHGATPTVGSGFTLLSVDTIATPAVTLLSETVAGQDLGVDVTAGSGSGEGIAFEIATAPAVDRVPYVNHMPQLLAH